MRKIWVDHTDQWRKSYRENKVKESEYVKLFIYNVPVSYSEHDLYKHLFSTNIEVSDIRQVSHSDARRKSFVVTVHKSICNAISNDDVFSYLRIGVREYIARRF